MKTGVVGGLAILLTIKLGDRYARFIYLFIFVTT